MQTDNLAEMVRSETPVEKSEQPTSLPLDPNDVKMPDPEVAIPDPSGDVITDPTDIPDATIRLTNLTTWFEDNRTNIPNVRRVRMDIAGINPDKTLLLSVILPNQGETEEPDRDIFIYKGADSIPVIDLPGNGMMVYSNGFEVHHPINDDYVLKCYGIRTGVIVLHCLVDGDHLIPFIRERVNRTDRGIILQGNIEDRKTSLATLKTTNSDPEALQIQYRQIVKALPEITTNEDAINWVLARQIGLMDVNHLLQLDDVMINMFT